MNEHKCGTEELTEDCDIWKCCLIWRISYKIVPHPLIFKQCVERTCPKMALFLEANAQWPHPMLWRWHVDSSLSFYYYYYLFFVLWAQTFQFIIRHIKTSLVLLEWKYMEDIGAVFLWCTFSGATGIREVSLQMWKENRESCLLPSVKRNIFVQALKHCYI